MRRTRLVSLAAVLLLTPALATAQVIDDFEQGSFNLSTSTFTSGTQSFLLPIHCISSDRYVEMQVNGNPSGADLSLGATDDEVTTVWGNDGGSLRFVYDLTSAPKNLYFSGVENSFRVNLTIAVAAGELEVVVRDIFGSSAASVAPVTGANSYIFPYTDFPGADLGAVEMIELILDVPDFGDYHISDFRAWEEPSLSAGMDVNDGSVMGPPYPTAPITIAMHGQEASGQTVQTELVALSLVGAMNADPDPETQLVAMDSGGGIGMPGEQVGIIVVDTQPAPTKRPHFRTWDTHWDFQGAGRFVSTLAGLPEIHLPSPGIKGEWAHMKWTTHSQDENGRPQFRTDYQLSVQVEPDKGLSFLMGVEPTPFNPSGFDLFFDVDVVIQKDSSKGIGENVLHMQLNASSYNYESAVAAPAWTGESIALWAQPNVMDASTQLWMSRALEKETRLRLFDLSGRAIRTLTVPAGREFTVWDGRDGRGKRVASGMYMLKALELPNSGSAKIVKLR